jgi:hypothetical protein
VVESTMERKIDVKPHKIDKDDVRTMLIEIFPIVLGILTAFVVWLLGIQSDIYLLLYIAGSILFGFGVGIFTGYRVMRRALLKSLVKEGVIQLEGKKGKEIMTFVRISEYLNKNKEAQQ